METGRDNAMDTNRIYKRSGSAWNIRECAGPLAAVFCSLLLSLALVFCLSVQSGSAAYANIYNASDAAAATGGEIPDSVNVVDDQESESIDDEDVPMASGLGGAEPVSSAGGGLQWAIVAGIAAVIAFFAAMTIRANRNISAMKNRFK